MGWAIAMKKGMIWSMVIALEPFMLKPTPSCNLQGTVLVSMRGNFVTASPCYDCFKLIANSGKKVFFGEFYRDERINKFAKSAKIELIDLSK